jgi:UPF0176 protein
MSTLVNISGYQFKPLTDLETLQDALKTHCRSQNFKGTILLSEEGINCFLSGPRATIDDFYQYIAEKGFTEMNFKESPSDLPPFKRMLVKIKSEIVTMGIPTVSPVGKRAPSISPALFKQWLDENQDIVVLDTRNDYEVNLGKFKAAIDLGISDFRSFPEAVKNLPTTIKNKKIVTYCTGGIRCEKAALYMQDQGFEDIYQLEGGILKYLEEFGNAHYEGECFVFDKRIAVDHTLNKTPTKQCYVCRQPVTLTEQTSEFYVEGQSCPRCFKTPPQTST